MTASLRDEKLSVTENGKRFSRPRPKDLRPNLSRAAVQRYPGNVDQILVELMTDKSRGGVFFKWVTPKSEAQNAGTHLPAGRSNSVMEVGRIIERLGCRPGAYNNC